MQVRDRFGGMVGFKGGLRGKERINSVIIAVFTEINYSCNNMQVIYFKCKSNIKACMGTMSILFKCYYIVKTLYIKWDL